MKAKEVHNLSDAEITEEIGNLRRRLFELRQQSVTEKIENPRQFGKIRRDIARLLTEQRQRELAAAAPATADA
ncbi:MAG: 50S ribosomal protein L29 [Planctomycetota bacterium]